MIKTYDIGLHTLATSECQDLASIFEERDRQNVAGMTKLYDKSIYDIQRYIQWPEINLEDEHPVSFAFFQELKDRSERTKVEVIVKEVISKEYIQEYIIKSWRESPDAGEHYGHCTRDRP